MADPKKRRRFTSFPESVTDPRGMDSQVRRLGGSAFEPPVSNRLRFERLVSANEGRVDERLASHSSRCIRVRLVLR